MMRTVAITFVCFAVTACVDTVPSPVLQEPSTAPTTSTSTDVKVSNGVLVPPQIKRQQAFQAGFTLRNTTAAPVQFAEIALSVSGPGGVHLFDAARWSNVTVSPGDTWSGTAVTAITSTAASGSYQVLARGRIAGGSWFNLPAAAGTNPAVIRLVDTGAFTAIIDRIQIYPSTVAVGTRVPISAAIRNATSNDTEWGGHATFRISTTVERNGQVVHEKLYLEQAFLPEASRIGFAPDSFDTSLPGRYDVRYVVRSGDNLNHFAVRTESFWVELPRTRDRCSPPAEASRRISYTAFWRAPFGYKGATPWISVAHDARQTGSSLVEVDFIRLWARSNGITRIVFANEYEEDASFGGELARRSPWFAGPIEPMPGVVEGGSLRIRPSDRPEMVWHPYLNRFPRDDVSAADSVWMEIRVRISGPAVLQAGLDYWRELTGVAGGANHEAAATDWICTPGAWQTLTLEPSTEVNGQISLFTNPPGATPQVGKPLEAVFVVRNRDNDTVRLTSVGIETRQVAPNDPYCDPSVGSLVIDGFNWKQTVVLAPGGRLGHTSTWVPRAPGRYCITVVEKREDTPEWNYQRTQFRPHHRWVDVAP